MPKRKYVHICTLLPSQTPRANAELSQYKEKGDESGLHIIIFDELDAIFKQRGSSNSGTGVGDTVVNQVLSKMDGVDQLNNILIIGMTNRIDMIDEALLRPGRLEVLMEISLPDEHGRYQILNIHTAKMRKNGVMDHDVDVKELARLTKNFSGAEIGGLVKSATSFAFNRHVKVGTMAGISDDIEDLRVNADDFANALDEVHPAFGVAEEELAQVVQNGIIHYDVVVDVRPVHPFCLSFFLRFIYIPFFTGITALRKALRRTGPHIDTHTARQSAAPWPTRDRKDRAGSDYRAGIRVPVYKAHHARQHGRLFRSTESARYFEGLRRQHQKPNERRSSRQHRASPGCVADCNLLTATTD